MHVKLGVFLPNPVSLFFKLSRIKFYASLQTLLSSLSGHYFIKNSKFNPTQHSSAISLPPFTTQLVTIATLASTPSKTFRSSMVGKDTPQQHPSSFLFSLEGSDSDWTVILLTHFLIRLSFSLAALL
ncbi:hypothetical protein NPIL_264571 [Nephila pilipes]|uniref:Uncharacterized protein n=1 Tax=Nephila pilipes TaxID=299642 RepID=A0A8X6PCX5_NEPPI|nr:hypothetical protein NPIL_264571 [Nephila pilipes]